MKLYSLLKAVFSQDMNMFKLSVNKEAGKLKRIILPIILFMIMLYAMGTYAFVIAQVLVPINMTHVMLTLFIIACTGISFIEGIYKSQGILFDSKDNDLLLSLPIKKSYILFARLIKLLTFQYLFNLMFLLPAIAVYAFYEVPGISFYITTLIMSILIPIIPTVCGSVIGYVIKLISSKFKKKKVIQSALSIIITICLFVIGININNLINTLATNANGINESIINIYYPIKLYLNLINEFNLLEFIQLLVINIIPLGIFVLIGAKSYYKLISKISEGEVTNLSDINNNKTSHKKTIVALVIKEIKRYFSSTIYVINTLFGPVLIFITTVYLCIKGVGVFQIENIPLPIDINEYLPAIYYILVLFVCSLTQITCSSISIEGKNINILKSLPISEKTIFDSKILTSFIIELPLIIIANILFIIRFRVDLSYTLLIFGITLAAILFVSALGLIINLRYPKMDVANDTEIVKQSMSVMITTFLGLIFSAVSSGSVIYLAQYIGIMYALLCNLVIVSILAVICYVVLIKKGPASYKKINV